MPPNFIIFAWLRKIWLKRTMILQVSSFYFTWAGQDIHPTEGCYFIYSFYSKGSSFFFFIYYIFPLRNVFAFLFKFFSPRIKTASDKSLRNKPKYLLHHNAAIWLFSCQSLQFFSEHKVSHKTSLTWNQQYASTEPVTLPFFDIR